MGDSLLDAWVESRIGHPVLAVVGLAAGLAGCSAQEDVAWHRVRDTGPLRAGMGASFPPLANYCL
ncbi:MAG: hypothetical protein PVF54_01610 [Anaerolineae bacterium]|jgi:hypothetical protein